MKSGKLITPFKVGIVVLLALAATIFMIVELTGRTGLGTEDGNTHHAYFDDVTGLAQRSRVMLSGIPVGRIERIWLDDGRARIDVVISKDITLYEGVEQPDGWHKNGAALAKKQATLIGDYYLELTPGTEGRVLESGDEIQNVIEALRPEEIFNKLSDITDDIQDLTHTLSQVFGGEEGRERFERLFDDLQAIVGTLRVFVEDNSVRLERVVTNADLISRDIREFTDVGAEALQEMIQDARTIVQEVKFIIGQSSGDLQAGLGTLRGTLTRLQSTLDSLNYSLQNVQDITDKVNEGEGTIGRLVTDPAIADSTERILAEADDFIGRIGRLKTIVQLRSEYHVQNEQLKNIAGIKIQPEPTKYYLLQFVDDYRGDTRVIREDVNTTRTDAQDPMYRETTVTTTDDFKFSAQLARGWEASEWLTMFGRFGIMESSGGVGGDLHFSQNESFRLQTDLFDFSADRNPRFRAMASWEVFQYAYVMGGVDDVFNDPRRDYFLGIGLEFNDEDLKALFATSGVPGN
jgi:phospholipid/cholesterol/gamma-HCH transport system substrate-binding protein